jgi:hypothetical protein
MCQWHRIAARAAGRFRVSGLISTVWVLASSLHLEAPETGREPGAQEEIMGSRRFGLTALPWIGGLVLALVACGGTKTSHTTDTPIVQNESALMRRATSCDDLTRALQTDITERLQLAVKNRGTSAAVGGIDMLPSTGIGGSSSWGAAGSAGAWAALGAGGAMGVAGSFATGSAGGSGGNTTTPPNTFTQTNTPVAGVDEADFVKSDGTNLYVVRNQTLHVVTAQPVQQMAELTRYTIEGNAFEMYLVGPAGSGSQQIVVYSTVDGTSMYAQAGLTPPGSTGLGGSMTADYMSPTYYPSVTLTKATVLGFSGSALSVQSEVYFEGSYVSSRRTDNTVRTVLQAERSAPGLRTYPTTTDEHRADLLVLERLERSGKSVVDLSSAQFEEMYSQALIDVIATDNKAAIAAITAENWVPRAFVKKNNGATAVAVPLPCDDFYIPKSGGGSLGVTFVADVDLTKLGEAPQGVAILGMADTMYQNGSALVLTALDWAAGGGDFVVPHTFVHRFDYGKQEPLTYTASALITGEIHNQFSIDEKDGNVRVVTTENGSLGLINHLYVLKADGGNLATIGRVASFAQGERIMSARFVGNTGYVVTFRQVDPLFAFDLTDPTKPTLLGELSIPGFSEYMQPLDDNHLLTVGQSGQGTVALKMFDVTDRSHPTLMPGDYTFSRYGTTDASVTHKAVTFYRDRGLLALPFSGNRYDFNTGMDVVASSLELFRVSLAAGIQSIGGVPGDSLIPADDPFTYCYGYTKEEGARFQRGQFINTLVYGIAHDGIVASDISAPAAVLGSFKLGNSCTDGYDPLYGGGIGTGGMAGGDFGVGGAAGLPAAGGGPAAGGAPGVGGADMGAGGDVGAGGSIYMGVGGGSGGAMGVGGVAGAGAVGGI